jgi:hypothetical protein
MLEFVTIHYWQFGTASSIFQVLIPRLKQLTLTAFAKVLSADRFILKHFA